MKILHPTDFSECAAQAQTTAVDLAGKLGGEIVLLQVLVETPLYGESVLNMPKVQSVYDAQRKWAEETLEARVGDLRQRGIKASWRVQVGVPFEEIVKDRRGGARGHDRDGDAWPDRAEPRTAGLGRRAGHSPGAVPGADGAADEVRGRPMTPRGAHARAGDRPRGSHGRRPAPRTPSIRASATS